MDHERGRPRREMAKGGVMKMKAELISRAVSEPERGGEGR
jgi:hypothetical protein